MKKDIPPTSVIGSGERAARATERRLESQRRSAAEEVDRILEVTLGLIERSAPVMPSVSDIVAAAGISNQTLYKTFGSKDELVLAVLERGVLRVAETAHARMAEVDDPRDQIRVWVRMVLRQVSAVDAAETSRSVLGYLHQAGVVEGANQAELLAPISALVLDPVTSLGGDQVSADCVSDLVLGAMRRQLWTKTVPTRQEIDEVAAFVLRGLGAEGSR